ncbi:hypothetical protein ABZ639_26725 [Saccharomonospora sp. NPDC006951]
MTAGTKRNRKGSRILAVIAAGLLVIGGGVFAALGWAQRDEGGYFGTAEQRFATETTALKSDEIDVGERVARAADPNPDLGELARMRITVRPGDPELPVFVGIGPKAAVEGFLSGVAHAEFTSATLEPFEAAFRQVPGSMRAPDPLGRSFWVASSSGTGERVVEWDKERGAWSVVVMRLDGRPGVDVAATIGLRFGFLLPAGIAALAAGSVLLAAGFRRAAQPKGDRCPLTS